MCVSSSAHNFSPKLGRQPSFLQKCSSGFYQSYVFHSTTPLCCGVPGDEKVYLISLFVQNSFIGAFLNYVPLSLLNANTLCTILVSRCLMWSIRICGVSSLLCKEYTHVYLIKSSTITRAYLFFAIDKIFTRPNKSRCNKW